MEKPDRIALVLEAISSPDAPFYVYVLVDPSTDSPFYVGKGTGERFRSHGIEAALYSNDASSLGEGRRKIAKIRSITEAGLEPRIIFARIRIPTEREAFLVEAALIDALNRYSDPLVNEGRGHATGSGMVSLDDLERLYAAPEFTTRATAILIKLGDWRPDPDPDVPRMGHGYRADLTPDELYASTRAWWVLGARRDSYRYAVAVHRGITRGVWGIDPTSWLSRRRGGERSDGRSPGPQHHPTFKRP